MRIWDWHGKALDPWVPQVIKSGKKNKGTKRSRKNWIELNCRESSFFRVSPDPMADITSFSCSSSKVKDSKCYNTATEFACSACLLCLSCPLSVAWCCIKMPCKIAWRATIRAKKNWDCCCGSEKRIFAADYSSFSDIEPDSLPSKRRTFYTNSGVSSSIGVWISALIIHLQFLKWVLNFCPCYGRGLFVCKKYFSGSEIKRVFLIICWEGLILFGLNGEKYVIEVLLLYI